MITKKYYIKFADMLVKLMSDAQKDSPASWTALCMVKDDMINLFRSDNPNFDSVRFENYIENKIKSL